jgi:hypothetical protein
MAGHSMLIPLVQKLILFVAEDNYKCSIAFRHDEN